MRCTYSRDRRCHRRAAAEVCCQLPVHLLWSCCSSRTAAEGLAGDVLMLQQQQKQEQTLKPEEQQQEVGPHC